MISLASTLLDGGILLQIIALIISFYQQKSRALQSNESVAAISVLVRESKNVARADVITVRDAWFSSFLLLHNLGRVGRSCADVNYSPHVLHASRREYPSVLGKQSDKCSAPT